MHHKKRLSLAVSAALGLSSMIAIPGQVFAQDADMESEEGVAQLSRMEIEETVVTGSRIISEDGFGRTSPVTVVGMDEISALGLTRVEDILNSLPQIEAAQNSFISNGATGTASIDLRGLGSNRTLVLINGHRMQPGGVATEAPDVNQIPAALIERVEVLTGGASATYGADAVAGVVNFIMRRVDGLEVSAGFSGYQHNNDNSYIQALMDKRNFEYPTGSSGIDGKAYNVDVLLGGEFAEGRGNATAYITYRKNDPLKQEARDYSSCALSTAGTACGGSGNAIIPNFYIGPLTDTGTGPYGLDYDQFAAYTLLPDSSFGPRNPNNVYNFAPVNFFMRNDERWSAGAFLDFEINEHAVAYMEIGFAHDKTDGQIAESGTFFSELYPLPVDQALFTPAFQASLAENFPGYDRVGIYIGKRNTEGGPRNNDLTHDGFRILGGLRGEINDDWAYDISYLNAQTSSSSTYTNDFQGPKVFEAVNSALCAQAAGCIPYQVFTYQGVTPEQAAGLAGTAIQTNQTSTKVFNAFVTGDTGWGLPAGNILAVMGYEWREQNYQNISDTLYSEGALLGQGGPTPSINGSYFVNELFAEANVPLLSGQPFAEQLNLDLAYRWSDYSTSGTASTYRIGLDWQAVDMLRMRTGFNRAVRAPNVNELFYPQGLGLWGGTDPCATATPVYTAAQCALTGVSASQYGNISSSPADQYNALYGGNPNLDPEVADTFTFGVVIDATDTMTVSFDYWDIKIADTISSINSELIIDQCALFSKLCDFITRSGSGSLWQGTAGYVEATTLNLGEQHWSGIDVAWAYALEGLGGTWNFNLIGTYMLKKETTPIPDDPSSTYDCVGLTNTQCFPTPDWRHSASTTYDSNGFWAVTGRWRFYSAVEYDGTADKIANDTLNTGTSYFDLNAVFRFMETHDVVIGVNNIFDKEPPLTGGTLASNANTIAGFYDTLGRYLFANVTLRW